MDVEAVLTIAREITVTGLLLMGIWGLITGRVVTRFQYDEMKTLYENRIQRLKDRP